MKRSKCIKLAHIEAKENGGGLEYVWQRIDDLMGQLERNEIKLEDLTNEDQKVILDILNQNA